MKGLTGFVALTALLGALAFAGSASATTFCVPGYFDACPDNGTNMLSLGSGPGPKLESAMAIDGSDGIPDTVYLDSGTYADADSFNVSGTDDLTLIGNGRDKTFLTSGASTNSYVLDLASGNTRQVTVRELAVVVPASFPNSGGNGAGIAESADSFQSVDLISRNDGSTGIFNPSGGSFQDFRAFGENGGSFGGVFYQYGSCGSGGLTIEGAEIRDATNGLIWGCADPAIVDRLHVTGTDDAIDIGSGGQVRVTNALIESADGPPIRFYTSANKTTDLSLDQVTVVATGDPSQAAIRGRVDNLASPTKDVNITVSNSIISGFADTWDIEAPTDPVKGQVQLSFDHSSFDQVGQAVGEAYTTFGAGNISGTPGFAGLTDFHLAAGSPAVDAGDPNATDPALDLEGNGRPIDGNRDGVAVRDMGAYELNPPPPSCPADPSVCLPRISKVKVKYRARKGGTLRFRLSREAKVLAVFTPVPKKAKGKKRRTVRVFRKAKAGRNTFKLGRKMLKPGRYRVAVRGIAADGDESNLVVRKLRVKPPRRGAGRA